MKTESQFNNFLTSGVQLADLETLRRIKVLNLFELAFVIVAPFLGLFYFYVGAFLLFYTTIIAGLLGIAVILLLRTTRDLVLTGNLAILILWGLLVIIRWNTGGMSTGGLLVLPWVWNAVLIFLAVFLAGYMWGTIWTCLVFLENAFAVFLFRTGHNFTNLVPHEISQVYSLLSYLIGLLAIFLVAFLFENERDDARKRDKVKSSMLRDSKRYIEDILNKLPIPTFVLDKSHNVVEWNRACQEMTGIAPYEILGKKVWEGFSLDEEGSLADKLLYSPDVFSEKYSESILSKSDTGSFAVETSLPHLKPGFRAIINTAPILDQDGRVKGAIQTIQDISAHNRGSGTGLGFIGDSIKESAYPVFKIDSKGKISGWNKACKESFGYSSAQMLGHSPLSLVSKPYRRDFKETVVEVFKGESFKGKEWKYYTSEGEPVYVLVKVFPVRALSGRVQECVVISADITDLKLRMEKLDRYAAESKDKLNKLGEEYTLLKRNVASFIRKKNE